MPGQPGEVGDSCEREGEQGPAEPDGADQTTGEQRAEPGAGGHQREEHPETPAPRLGGQGELESGQADHVGDHRPGPLESLDSDIEGDGAAEDEDRRRGGEDREPGDHEQRR